MPHDHDLQSDLFATKNAFDAVATIIDKKLEDLTPEANTFRQLEYLTRHGLADLQRALVATGKADEAWQAEARAAALLDRALTARHESFTAAFEHDDFEHPDAVAADKREDEAEAALLAIEGLTPGVVAAQLAYLVVGGENGDHLFEGDDRAAFLDFTAAAERECGLPLQQGAAKIVARYLAAWPYGPVAEVITRHRKAGAMTNASAPAQAAE